MWYKIKIWIEKHYLKVINSIAFYPALIVILFLGLSGFMIAFDFSEQGKQFKSNMHWMSLKDANTARAIISAIVAGIISLAVFSFSMVMIVLNQAASQMSNRVLDKLIGNNFQQIVLGIYIGTIVYALFLLSTIRDIDSGIYVPALSTYLLIIIAIGDIILFIYFLHYITQSVKYEVIIGRIYKETKASMTSSCCLDKQPDEEKPFESDLLIYASMPGIFEGFNKDSLLNICQEHDCNISIELVPGNFVLKGVPIARISKKIPGKSFEAVKSAIHISETESIEGNYFYGFRQLVEVAVKALSPGINDPGTAIVSLRSLFKLLAYRLCYYPDTVVRDQSGNAWIYTREHSFEEVFSATLYPIWDYGKNDRMLSREMQTMLMQLHAITPNATVSKMLHMVSTQMHNW